VLAAGADVAGAGALEAQCPPPYQPPPPKAGGLHLDRAPRMTPRTKWTRRVPHPVLIGHAARRGWQALGPPFAAGAATRACGGAWLALPACAPRAAQALAPRAAPDSACASPTPNFVLDASGARPLPRAAPYHGAAAAAAAAAASLLARAALVLPFLLAAQALLPEASARHGPRGVSS
jgi:hypothetical protein